MNPELEQRYVDKANEQLRDLLCCGEENERLLANSVRLAFVMIERLTERLERLERKGETEQAALP